MELETPKMSRQRLGLRRRSPSAIGGVSVRRTAIKESVQHSTQFLKAGVRQPYSNHHQRTMNLRRHCWLRHDGSWIEPVL